MTSTAEFRPAVGRGDWIRSTGALVVGAALLAAMAGDLPSPLPWAYGLLPVTLLWLARRVGLLVGTLAATSTLGAVYAAGLTEPAALFFVAVLAGAGLLLAACARRGFSASQALVWAVAPVLAVTLAYLVLGGAAELRQELTARLDEVRRMGTDHWLYRGSQALTGATASEFERALVETGKIWNRLLPSLIAIHWVLVMAINCWLASVLFHREDGFPIFGEFSTWRVHPLAAWALAVALLLVLSRVKPVIDAGVNLAFPLALAYTIQGLAVGRFLAIAHQVRWPVQVAVLILIALMPILLIVFLGVGFLDAWFDFRWQAVAGPDDAGDARRPGDA